MFTYLYHLISSNKSAKLSEEISLIKKTSILEKLCFFIASTIGVTLSIISYDILFCISSSYYSNSNMLLKIGLTIDITFLIIAFSIEVLSIANKIIFMNENCESFRAQDVFIANPILYIPFHQYIDYPSPNNFFDVLFFSNEGRRLIFSEICEIKDLEVEVW